MKPVIFAAELKKPLSQYEFSLFMALMDNERKTKAESLKVKSKADISLVGNALAKHAINNIFKIPVKDLVFALTRKDKPFLLNHKGVHFNISHCDNYAVCAVSTMPVGIDIQRITVYNPRISNRFFTLRQIDEINNSIDKDLAYSRIWTRREAYAKLTGEGILKKDYNDDLVISSFQYLNYFISVAAAEAHQ